MSEIINDEYFYSTDHDQFSFIKLPAALLTDDKYSGISNEAKLLYALMLNRMTLTQKNGWYDENNRVYIIFTVKEAQERFRCGTEKITKLFGELDDVKGIGLISRVRLGQGRPAVIYLRKFDSGNTENPESGESKTRTFDNRNSEQSDSGNPKVSTFDNPISGASETENQDFRKSKSNYIDIIKTENNYTEISQSIEPARERENGDGMAESETEKIVKANIEYNVMVENNRGDKEAIAMINEVAYLIAEVIDGRCKVIANNTAVPAEKARERFLMLDYDQVMNVIDRFLSFGDTVRNPKAFLASSLYTETFMHTINEFRGIQVTQGIKCVNH